MSHPFNLDEEGRRVKAGFDAAISALDLPLLTLSDKQNIYLAIAAAVANYFLIYGENTSTPRGLLSHEQDV